MSTATAIQKLRITAICLVLSLFTLVGCDPTGGENEVIISGQVIDGDSGDAIENALIEIESPEELQQDTRSDEDGNFSLTAEVTEPTDVTLRISRTGYEEVALNLRIASGGDETGLEIELFEPGQDDSDGGGGGDDDGDEDGGVGGESGGAASIQLTNLTNQSINIIETGGTVHSAFTFTVQDSAGRNISSDNAVDVQFDIIKGPGGGESISPSSVRTNSNGTVTSNLYSGNRSGTVRIEALIERPDVDLEIRSQPIFVSINDGFPDNENIYLVADVYNFEAYNIAGNENQITMYVNDSRNNPVVQGTSVNFTTTAGTIEGQAVTDELGRATVTLMSNGSRPENDSLGTGYAVVTAETVDENNDYVIRQTPILFTTGHADISATPTTFDLDPNGGASFDYTVTDLNGNPMAAGTQITVEAEGVELSGDVEFTLGDHLAAGPGATDFRFSIRDDDPDSDEAADLTIKITVVSPSGETTTYSEIQGIRRKMIQ